MMFHRLLRIALCLACLAMVGVAGASTEKPGSADMVSNGQDLPPPDTTSTAGAYTGLADYRIGAQDLIEISVFQVPDLNRTVRVNSIGQISLPLIGTVQAGGMTVAELERAIAAKLEASYLQNPQVSAFIKEYTSQRVTLEGELVKPGIYSLTGKTSLLQTVAMAGGVTELANLQGVVIFRQVDGKKMGARFDLKAIRAGVNEDPQIYGDDIIVIDKSGSKSALHRILQALPLVSIFTLL